MLLQSEAQDLLYSAGLWFVKNPPSGDLAFWLDYATREFQCYAKLPKVAIETGTGKNGTYLDRLTPGDNPKVLPAATPITGDYNDADTVASLKAWKDAGCRIPVILSAMKKAKGAANYTVFEGQSNIWLPQDAAVFTTIFATDMSGIYFPWDANNPQREVGYCSRYQGVSAPEAIKGHGANTPITFQTLTGQNLPAAGDPQTATQMTYRAIAGVAAAETEQCFDAVNAYDAAVISSGLYQWTLGVVSKVKKSGQAVSAPGELGAYMALLKTYLPSSDVFDQVMTRWGMDVELEWSTIYDTPKASLFDPSVRIYTTRFMHQSMVVQQPTSVSMQGRQAKTLCGWHWLYRFQAASRYIASYQQGMWDMTRIRLRDVMDVPWAKTVGDGVPFSQPAGQPKVPAKLGQVFRSEQALALLIRWHVWRPAEIIGKNGATGALLIIMNEARRTLFRQGGIDLSQPVEKWGDKEQVLLVAKMMAQAPKILPHKERSTPAKEKAYLEGEQKNRDSFKVSLERALKVKTDLPVSTLSAKAEFVFDNSGLPEPPKI